MVKSLYNIQECVSNPCASHDCRNNATCQPQDVNDYKCICQPHYKGRLCELKMNTCSVNPCARGLICEPTLYGGFTCKCPPTEPCDHYKVGSEVPQFRGDSYFSASKLEDVRHAFTVEMWFMSDKENAMLLYSGQAYSDSGDFIALYVNNRHIHFAFDLGSGCVDIVTKEKINLGIWHVMRASQLERDGTLQLDGGLLAHGQSPPGLSELDLSMAMYIGGTPNSLTLNRNVENVTGLVGAIQLMSINGQTWNELGLHPHKITVYNGHPCPISANPCQNGGVCIPILNTFTCQCEEDYVGRYCQIHIEDETNGINSGENS